MRWFAEFLFPVVWAAYLIYWQLMAGRVKSVQRIESMTSRLVRSVVFLIGIALLCLPDIPLPVLYRHFMPESWWAFWVGAAITVSGLLFSIWARLHLGANWSRSVTIKQDHELITSGPYALVRHPIYTGLLTAFLGTGMATTQVRGIVAFVLVFLCLLYKLRMEERFMRVQFGDVYERYARRVAALIPKTL